MTYTVKMMTRFFVLVSRRETREAAYEIARKWSLHRDDDAPSEVTIEAPDGRTFKHPYLSSIFDSTSRGCLATPSH